ncbi:MAG: dockerin type I domain-containing protein [Candidatus Zixiibacteriota bacterium]
MLKKTSTILIVSLLMFVLLATSAFAAQSKSKGTLSPSARIKASANALAYSFTDERPAGATGALQQGRIPIGAVAYSSAAISPGRTVGDTWYDQQHNGSMGRMIETGPHSGQTGATTVHFSWMYSPDATIEERSYAYNAYISGTHQYAGAYVLHSWEYSGYVNIDVTPDNRGIVGGHTDVHGLVKYQPQMHFDDCSTCEDFAAFTRLPDSLAVYGQEGGNTEATWPKFFLQFGTDTVLHVVAGNDYGAYYMSLMYFRCVGYEGQGIWDYPPYVFDTVRDIAYDITAQRMDDRVGITWMAHPPYEEPWCDTCSGNTPTAYLDWGVGQMDNDVYVQVSNDQGANWEPKQNLTKVPIGEAALKGYCDNSILLDQEGYLHVIWHAHPWPSDPDLTMNWGGDGFFWPDKSRLMHWSENVPYLRTICDHTYDPSDSCGSPGWAMTVAKPTLSECDGKLYAIWSQFNDVPGGIIDDCADWRWDDWNNYYWGGANAEIWVSVSDDGGLTWDRQRNLTNSYTPYCDPEIGEDCQSDYWASMSRWGRQVQAGEDWSAADIVDPSGGSSPTNWYLDIQYVNDLEAGRAISTDDYEGEFTNNPIKWFRMPCVEPVPNPIPVFSLSSIGFPAWEKPGVEFDTLLLIENVGNANYNYTVSFEEDNGTAGWLGVSGLSGTCPSGLDNVETGAIVINQGGIVDYAVILTGRVTFSCTEIETPTVIDIEFLVADTLIFPDYDTVHTSCIALICGNNGNVGGNGYPGVTMDYIRDGDCDTTALNYMFEGSPLIGWVNGDDTVVNYYMWGGNWANEEGLLPQGGMIATKVCDNLNAEVFHSGVFSSNDSTIAMEKVVVAPLDDCPFIIEYLKVYSYDGLAHSGLLVGEAIDWDIPWDYRDDDTAGDYWDVNNYGGFDAPRALVYQQGYEASGDWDTLYPFDCQLNNERYGGNAFVASYFNGSFAAGGPYSAFVQENDSLQETDGWFEGKLYYELMGTGFKATDSIEDLHTAMCFDPSLDLGATDYYEVVTVLATVHQGTLADLQAAVDAGKTWYTNNGGIAMFADVDGAGGIDMCQGCCELVGDLNGDDYLDPLDVTFYVNWLWKGGPAPSCCAEADINGDCFTDPLDLTAMVNYIWKGGLPPASSCDMSCWLTCTGSCD